MNLEVVKDYYGKVLKSSKDLKTSACCDGGNVPAELEALLAKVHEEVRAKYYGCGIVVPQALRGARVLDLGSGSGRDVYLISQLVGPEGEVVGVDMTDEQLATAEAHADWHMRRLRLLSAAMCTSSKAISRNSASLASRPQASTRSCRIA